jgi:hypothetical protein
MRGRKAECAELSSVAAINGGVGDMRPQWGGTGMEAAE